MPLCFWYGSRSGAEGLVMAWHIAAPLLLAVTLALTLPAVGARLRDLAAALLPVVTGCAAMTIGVVALTPYLEPSARTGRIAGPGRRGCGNLRGDAVAVLARPRPVKLGHAQAERRIRASACRSNHHHAGLSRGAKRGSHSP